MEIFKKPSTPEEDEIILLDSDPTLSESIHGEIEFNRKTAMIKSILRKNDRVAHIESLHDNVLTKNNCSGIYFDNEYPCLASFRAARHESKREITEVHCPNSKIDNFSEMMINDSFDESDEDSEYNLLLDDENIVQLQYEEKMKALEQEHYQNTERSISHQLGYVHCRIPPRSVFDATGLVNSNGGRLQKKEMNPSVAVIHLYQNSDICASLDLCLEDLARTYFYTKFVRSDCRLTLYQNRDFVNRIFSRLDNSSPALIAVKNGVVVCVCQNFSIFQNPRDDSVELCVVEEWLKKAGVLFSRERYSEEIPQQNKYRREEKVARESNNYEREEQIYQCGIRGCQKAYYHEHIGIQNEKQDGRLIRKKAATGCQWL